MSIVDQWYWGKVLVIQEKQGEKRYKIRYVDNDISPSFLRPSAVYSLQAAVKILPGIKPPAEFVQELQGDKKSREDICKVDLTNNDSESSDDEDSCDVDLTKEESEDSDSDAGCIDLTRNDNDDEEELHRLKSRDDREQTESCPKSDTTSPDEAPNLAWANAYRQAHITLENDGKFERSERARKQIPERCIYR